MPSTDEGHINPQNQRVIRKVGPSPTLPGQHTYELECLRPGLAGTACGHRYGANGPDIDGAGAGSGRRCPKCQNGSPGDPIMPEFNSIKELVVETCIARGDFPAYEQLTELVLRHFPTSRWQRTHYAWYKSRIRRGIIQVPGITEYPTEAEREIEAEAEDAVEASLSLERDLHSYLAQRVAVIESGLTLIEGGVEYTTEAGRIDLLAKDPNGSLVVIELKAGKAGDAALGQLLGYIGCLSTSAEEVRGIMVALPSIRGSCGPRGGCHR